MSDQDTTTGQQAEDLEEIEPLSDDDLEEVAGGWSGDGEGGDDGSGGGG